MARNMCTCPLPTGRKMVSMVSDTSVAVLGAVNSALFLTGISHAVLTRMFAQPAEQGTREGQPSNETNVETTPHVSSTMEQTTTVETPSSPTSGGRRKLSDEGRPRGRSFDASQLSPEFRPADPQLGLMNGWSLKVENGDALAKAEKAPPPKRHVQKNYTKWYSVPNTGNLILGRILPMKTIGIYNHEVHTVDSLMEKFPKIGMIIDLTSEPDPYSLESYDVEYVKMLSISKQLPKEEEVDDFCITVDTFLKNNPGRLVGVHCHYGFNRTGFFMVSYLCKRGVPVETAIEMFAEARAPGIKHEYFKDELRSRYEHLSTSHFNPVEW